MDQHPVPQDITGFQFKLVGDMTLKQFGYLAAGAVIAWVFYITNWNPIVKMPLAFFSFTFGIALAFLPIQERPLETWIVNFIKSVYRPTQFIWKKATTKLDFANETAAKKVSDLPLTTLNPNPANEEQLQAFLSTMKHASEPDTAKNTNNSPPQSDEPDKEEAQENEEKPDLKEPVLTIDDLLAKKTAAENPPVTIDALIHNREVNTFIVNSEMRKVRREVKNETPQSPDIDDLAKISGCSAPSAETDNLTYAVTTKQRKIDETEAINRKLIMQIDDLNQKIAELTRKHENQSDETFQYLNQLKEAKGIVEELNAQKARLEEELKMAKKGEKPIDPKARVKFTDRIPINKVIDGKLPPNTIHGLVDDQKGIALSGVIVLIKNASGAPVRALRTNKLGQFIASTPLENGTYIVEVEKEGYDFDEVEFELTGTTLSPIEIKAK